MDVAQPKFKKIWCSTQPLSGLVIEERHRKRQFSAALLALVEFILDKINVKVDSPEYETVTETIEREMEYFPNFPIIRKPVEYHQDFIYYHKKGKSIPSHPDETKTLEAKEFEDLEIYCNNDHQHLRGLSSGM